MRDRYCYWDQTPPTYPFRRPLPPLDLLPRYFDMLPLLVRTRLAGKRSCNLGVGATQLEKIRKKERKSAKRKTQQQAQCRARTGGLPLRRRMLYRLS